MIIKNISGGGGSANSLKWVGTWTTAYAYRKNDQVVNNNDMFTCSVSHTAGASTEPGTGASWTTKWIRNVDVLSTVEKSSLVEHIADTSIHAEIDDSSTLNTKLWSAYKANAAIAAAEAGVYTYVAAVLDILNDPPITPTTGDRYVIGVGTGAWAGEDNNIAEYGVSSWSFTDATAGMATYVTDVSLLYLFSGTTWNPVQNYSLASDLPGVVDYDAATVGSSIKVAKEDHTHDLNLHDHSSSEINLDSLGETSHTLEDYIHLQSAGRISGGVITDDGNGGVDITEVGAWLRTSDTELDHLMFVTVSAGNIASGDLTDNALNYICVGYNNAMPIFYTTTNRAGISENTQVVIGRIYKAGNNITVFNGGMNLPNYARINHDRLVRRGFERMSGADVYETGTRCLGLTSGIYYFGMNKITITAKDTSGTDRYTAHKRDGLGGWTKIEDKTDIHNTQYDNNSGTPAVAPDGTYLVKWIYVDLLGELHAVDGQGYYALAEAKVVPVPSTLPTYISTFCKLAAKVIILKGATHFEMVVSGYESALFGTTSASLHEGLGGLLGGQTAEHYHLTATEHTALTTDFSDSVTGITDSLYSEIGHDHDSDYSGITHDHNSTYSVLSHAHASAYAALAHDHDSAYSALNHTHASAYAALTHSHSESDITDLKNYSLTSHNHSSTYAALVHTHASVDLTDCVAPTTWNPVLVWSGAAPVYTAVARYTKIGKLVTFWLSITGTDGDGRKLTSVTLPLEPKNVGMTISCAAQTAAPTTRSDPYAYIVANTDVTANKLLQFYTALTFGNNLAFNMNVTGQYEVE